MAATVGGDAARAAATASKAGFDLSLPAGAAARSDIIGASCMEEKAGDGSSKITAIVLSVAASTPAGATSTPRLADGLVVLLPSGVPQAERADWVQWVRDTHGRDRSVLGAAVTGDREVTAYFDTVGGRLLRDSQAKSAAPDVRTNIASSLVAGVRKNSIQGGAVA